MRSQLGDLRRELRDYEALRRGEIVSRTVDSLRDLPVALIERRIVRRLTQKQLARKLGVPEQQIQRYGRTRYKGASIVARPLRFGPPRVRVLLSMQNGREEDRSREAQTTHAGADRQEAQGGRQDVGRWHRGARGLQGPGGFRGDVSP